MNWKQILALRPWFRLKLKDGEIIQGRILKDKSLELITETMFGQQLLKLTESETEALRRWLNKVAKETLREKRSDGESAQVLSISRSKGPTGDGA